MKSIPSSLPFPFLLVVVVVVAGVGCWVLEFTLPMIGLSVCVVSMCARVWSFVTCVLAGLDTYIPTYLRYPVCMYAYVFVHSCRGGMCRVDGW
ncbi:hypothetical protein GGS21DRAFT_524498 [Xylaria nigripes]|nr:hypothetical protein GGS21DRAFT_524498 [Xylaria nigripes]